MKDKYIEVKGKLFWHYVIKSKNGQTVHTSQVYYSKSNALRAARKFAKEFNLKVV